MTFDLVLNTELFNITKLGLAFAKSVILWLYSVAILTCSCLGVKSKCLDCTRLIMSALKKIFGRKSDETEDSTSPGAEEGATGGAGESEPVTTKPRGIMFAGEDEDDEPPKRKGGGISFAAEPLPPDSKDKKKKNKPKQVRVVIEDDAESGKKTKSKSTSSKTKSQPLPAVSPVPVHVCVLCCTLYNSQHC